MATVAKLFSRLSGGKPAVTPDEAQKTLSGFAGLGRLSLSGPLLKKGIELGLKHLDADSSGDVSEDEFSQAMVRHARSMPAWDQFAPQGATSVDADALTALADRAVRSFAGPVAGLIDTKAVARIVLKLMDDDGDQRVSQTEYEELASDVAQRVAASSS